MHELHNLANSQLMDLLAKLTADYTKMITDSSSVGDYEKCKLTIRAIQTELETRKNKVGGVSGETHVTMPPDFS